MPFHPVHLGSLITLICVTSASDIPVSTGGKESNVTSVTSVFLPPSLSAQVSKEATKPLSDDPFSVEYHQMDGPSTRLTSLQEEYEKLKKAVEERKATYTKAKEDFDLKRKEDEKELAKLDAIVKEREELEKNLKKEKEKLDTTRTEIDEEERVLREDEAKLVDLQNRKEEVERKEEELKSLLATLDKLNKTVKLNLGECIEVPEALKKFWMNSNHPDTRLCIKT